MNLLESVQGFIRLDLKLALLPVSQRGVFLFGGSFQFATFVQTSWNQ